jgi:hypothetical protein
MFQPLTCEADLLAAIHESNYVPIFIIIHSNPCCFCTEFKKEVRASSSTRPYSSPNQATEPYNLALLQILKKNPHLGLQKTWLIDPPPPGLLQAYRILKNVPAEVLDPDRGCLFSIDDEVMSYPSDVGGDDPVGSGIPAHWVFEHLQVRLGGLCPPPAPNGVSR